MKRAIRQIDRAVKNLYNLESKIRAQDFLLDRPMESSEFGNVGSGKQGETLFRGTLYIRPESEDLSLGIYLSESTQKVLSTMSYEHAHRWSQTELAAFAVAAEEVSHFHYVVHHAQIGRSVSQLELELQGEVDRFWLSFFAFNRSIRSADLIYEGLFEKFFGVFQLRSDLRPEERERYLQASRLAQRLIQKFGKSIGSEKWLKGLRRFYRLDASEKMSFINQQ